MRVSSAAMMRADVSDALPGACGTMNRSGRSGDCAAAVPDAAAMNTNVSADAMLFMDLLLLRRQMFARRVNQGSPFIPGTAQA